MAAGHAELIGEMAAMEKLSMPDRLKHAKKRRAQQLKAYTQYEKQLSKETAKKSKKGQANEILSTVSRSVPKLRFDPSILLLEATMRNDVDEVSNLLIAGVDPNVSNEDGLRALHQCSIDNLEEVMKLLIQFGANVNVCDTELWTPLHAAATCGHLASCRYLIEHGAELLAVNSDGNMPYDLCEDPDTLDYIESEMAKRGVTQEMIDDIRLSAENKMLSDLKQLHENGGDLEYVGASGETPLHIAACNGFVYVAEFLLMHHVAVNIPDDDGWMPLHCAACWGQLQLVELLLLHGADFEARTKSGETTIDLCEDIEMKQRVLEVVEEVENKQPHKSRDSSMKRRNSAARKGSTATAHAMRRTNPHDKNPMAHIEAQNEAIRLRESITSVDEDDDDDENFVILDAITVPQPTESDDIDLNLPEDTSASVFNTSSRKAEPKPIKSIISKSTHDSNSQRKSSIPLSSDIWMSHSYDGVSEKSEVSLKPPSGGKENKKEQKKGNKKDSKAADKTSKSKSNSETTSGDFINGNKNSAASATSSKNPKALASPDETVSLPSNDLPKSGNVQVQFGSGAKGTNGKAQTGIVANSTKELPSSISGSNKLKEQTLINDVQHPKAQIVAPSTGVSSAEATSKNTKTVTGTTGASVVLDSSKNVNHTTDGLAGQAIPSGTLSDLKKQRARRLQDTLAFVKENGKPSALPDQHSPNGDAVDLNDRNANNITSHAAGTSSFGGERQQRRYSNPQEVVDGNNQRCCILL